MRYSVARDELGSHAGSPLSGPRGRAGLLGSAGFSLAALVIVTFVCTREFEGPREEDDGDVSASGGASSTWSVAYSPDGRWFASASTSGVLRVEDRATGARRVVASRRSLQFPKTVAFSPDSRVLVVADQGVSLAEEGSESLGEEDGLEIRTMSGKSVAFSPDGTLLAVDRQHARLVEIRRWATGEVVASLSGPLTSGQRLTFSPDGRELAVGCSAGEVILFDVMRGRERLRFPVGKPLMTSLVYLGNGTLATAGRLSPEIQISEVQGGRLLRTLAGGGSGIAHLSLSPDRRSLMAACMDGTVRWFARDSGLELCWRRERLRYVRDLALSPDGQLLAAAGEPSSAVIWRMGSPWVSLLHGSRQDGGREANGGQNRRIVRRVSSG